jgi:Amt family ammonium transporter
MRPAVARTAPVIAIEPPVPEDGPLSNRPVFTKRRFLVAGLATAALVGPFAAGAFAAEPDEVVTAVNNTWVILAGALVFLMQAGFALVEAGFTRAKNTTNIAMKNFMDFSVGALAYWAVGFGLAYGGSTIGGFVAYGGIGDAFFVNNTELSTSWFFQVVFAATAATIVSGAMAERTKFSSYLLYTVFITGFIYPIVSHWAWGGGFLSQLTPAYIDFAGSGVVHLVGGTAALAGVIAIGPRIGRYGPNGEVRPMPGHSLLLATVGVFLLWFGWYGFNGGSTLAAVGADFPSIIVTTTLAAAAGGTAAMFVSWAHPAFRKPDPGMTLNGCLAGLVGITAGCANVNNVFAVVIGIIAGVIVVFSVLLLDRLKLDDPVGAISVHGVAGAWGVLAVGLFDTANGGGLLVGGGVSQLISQTIGVIAIFAWTFVTSSAVFWAIKLTVGLRVSAQEELEGLDMTEHGVQAWPEFMPGAVAEAEALEPVA